MFELRLALYLVLGVLFTVLALYQTRKLVRANRYSERMVRYVFMALFLTGQCLAGDLALLVPVLDWTWRLLYEVPMLLLIQIGIGVTGSLAFFWAIEWSVGALWRLSSRPFRRYDA